MFSSANRGDDNMVTKKTRHQILKVQLLFLAHLVKILKLFLQDISKNNNDNNNNNFSYKHFRILKLFVCKKKKKNYEMLLL